MTMYKHVSGVDVLCSPEEEAAILAEWASNDPTNKTPAQIDAEMLAEMTKKLGADKVMRLLFEINFDQENRLRTLAGQPAITRAQYRNALKTVWASL